MKSNSKFTRIKRVSFDELPADPDWIALPDGLIPKKVNKITGLEGK